MVTVAEAVEKALQARRWSSDDIRYWNDLGRSASEHVDLAPFAELVSHCGDGWNTCLAVAMQIADSLTPLTDQVGETHKRTVGGVREGLKSGLYARLMKGDGRQGPKHSGAV